MIDIKDISRNKVKVVQFNLRFEEVVYFILKE